MSVKVTQKTLEIWVRVKTVLFSFHTNFTNDDTNLTNLHVDNMQTISKWVKFVSSLAKFV